MQTTWYLVFPFFTRGSNHDSLLNHKLWTLLLLFATGAGFEIRVRLLTRVEEEFNSFPVKRDEKSSAGAFNKSLMSAFIKIPFIFVTTFAVTASLRNPNPVITDRERRPDDSKLFMYLLVKHIVHLRNMFWLAAAVETAVIILAEGNPTSREVTDHALRILVPKNQINLYLTPLSITGSLLVVAGSWLRVQCFRALDQLFTFEMTVREKHRLITHGPYRYVRHPSYTGSTMVFIGTCCWFASSGSWIRESGILGTMAGKALVVGFMTLYSKLAVCLLQRMPEEDKLMKASFGKEWEEWARQVPYWLIPGIY